MELQDMACCGLYELVSISDYGSEEDEYYNPATGEYEIRQPAKGTKLQACKRAIEEQLDGIDPRPRMVIATTIRGMRTPIAALRALRFRPIERFQNGNSGNRVTVWTKIVR